MGGHKTISGSSYPTPVAPVPVADYHVAVNPALNPDCSCNYFLTGTYNEHPYYRRADGLYFIWRHVTEGEWIISDELGVDGNIHWGRILPSIVGNYLPENMARGTATVSAGPH